MKVKNVNPLEKHVEKITLAVAALVAGYIGYNAFTDPVIVDSKSTLGPVTAGDLEAKLGAKVDMLTKKWTDNLAKHPVMDPTDYVYLYQHQPLAPLPKKELAIAWVPKNVAPDNLNPGTSRNERGPSIATPHIPAPINVTAKPDRGLVLKGDDANAAPQDLTWVTVKADYPMAKLQLALAGDDLPANQRIPKEAYRVTFFRVDVRREEQQPDGSWSSWSTIPPVQSQELYNPDALINGRGGNALAEDLTRLDATLQAILNPHFYTRVDNPAPESGSGAAPPKSADLQAEEAARRDRLNHLQQNNPRPGGLVPPGADRPNLDPATGMPLAPHVTTPAPRPTPSRSTAVARGPSDGPPVSALPPGFTGPGDAPPTNILPPGGPAEGPPDANKSALLALDAAPIWFYDENVKPGHVYKYQMRVRLYNPLYHLELKLAEPLQSNKPWLQSDWADVASPVTVPATRHFFISKAIDPTSKKASVKIYQWDHGQWLSTDEDISPGNTIGQDHAFAGITDKVNLNTGYTVVNIDNDQNSTRAVLLTPSGDLIVRDSNVDYNSAERQQLDTEIHNAQNPPPPTTPTPG